MSRARVFFTQEALEAWMAEGRAQVVGETMVLDGQSFTLETAVRFVNEVAGGGDEGKLVGRVKSLAQIGALGGEHCADSVVLGDNAYEVVEGFLAAPEHADLPAAGANQKLLELFAGA